MRVAFGPENASACPDRVTVKEKGIANGTGDVKLMFRIFEKSTLTMEIASDDEGNVLSGYDPDDECCTLLLTEFIRLICGTKIAEEICVPVARGQRGFGKEGMVKFTTAPDTNANGE
jgi:hypothetical protein